MRFSRALVSPLQAAALGLAAHAAASPAASFSTITEGHDHLQPGGWVDYAITGAGAVIVLVVIYYAVRWFVRPKETEAAHIKRKILEGPRW